MNLLEAQWLGQRLASVPDEDLFPLLNVGSSTQQFRSVTQPYIEQYIFEPLRRRGGRVHHIDIKPEPGVDLVGDLRDPSFRHSLSLLRPRAVMLSNLLEHVVERETVCQSVLDLLPVGGYLFVSGPHRYPYHADPIDTMFRPSVPEVAAHFPGTSIVDSAILDSGNWRQWNPCERGRGLGRTLLRLLAPFYRPAKWFELLRQSPYVFRHIQAFAVVLRRDVVSGVHSVGRVHDKLMQVA